MTRAEQIRQYNELHYKYHITGIKKMTKDQIEGYIKWGSKSLDDHYVKPSQAKQDSYRDILTTYRPKSILSVQGSCHTYSVLLVAENGDILHITQSNNYLIERV